QIRRPSVSTLFPYTTLFRSRGLMRPNLAPTVVPCGDAMTVLAMRRPVLLLVAGLALAGCSQSTPTRVDENAVPTNYKKEIIDLRSEEHTSELQSRRDLVCRL